MRYLTIPTDIPTKDLPQVSTDTLSFHGFFLNLVAPQFPLSTVAEIKNLDSIATKMAAIALPGDVVELSDAEHTALQVAMPVVQGPLLIRMLAFYSAVAGATTAAPVPTPQPGPEAEPKPLDA